MKDKITLILLTIAVSYACILRADAQRIEHFPGANLDLNQINPPGSYLNPIYVQPIPPVYQPPVIYSPPQINIQPREREYIPVYPRQERLAPRAEFERVTFIPTEPYVYFLSRGDTTSTCGTTTHDMNAKIQKGETRIVIGKTKVLNTDLDSTGEVLALEAKYHVDEIIAHSGRQWSDGGELLIKFVIWKPSPIEPNSTSQAMPTPPPITYRLVNVRANDYLSLRQGPGSDYDVIRKLPSGIGGIQLGGSRVSNGETIWQEISIAGQSGYVNEIYLEAER